MKLIHGDCLEEMKNILDESIDFIFSDLPYSDEKIKRVTANKWDVGIDLEKVFIEFNRILKKQGVIVMTATNPFSSILLYKSIELQEKYKWDLKYKYEWIWQKDNLTNFTATTWQPGKVHEHMLVFGKSATTFSKKGEYMPFNPIKTKGEPYACMSGKGTSNLAYSKNSLSIYTENLGERHPITIQKFTRDKMPKGQNHPTQKPIVMGEYLLKTYTNEGAICLDPTMGNGSFGVACKNLNRHFIGIELDEGYYKISCERTGFNI